MKRSVPLDTLTAYENETGWLVTYADLVTLLLVLFILLFTMAGMEREHYRATIESINVKIDANSPTVGLMELLEIPETPDTRITIEDITGLRSRKKNLIKDVNDFVADTASQYAMSSRVLDGKIIVSVGGHSLFESGSADLKPSATILMDTLAQLLEDYPEYRLNIQGHTDNIPIATVRFPSNWDLSAIRATTVLKHLILLGIDPGRMTATGYGDVAPLLPNTSDANRAINRRVEFVLEKETSPL